MAITKQRYVASGDIQLNGVTLKGVRFVLAGPCGFSGNLKDPDGKKLRKTDAQFLLLRFEEKKVPRQLKIPNTDLVVSAKSLAAFFAPTE